MKKVQEKIRKEILVFSGRYRTGSNDGIAPAITS